MTDDVKKLEDELKRLQKTKPSRPMAISVREAKDIGDFYICIRGVVHNRGEVVPRGFLQVASSEPVRIPTGESGRRQLADWLASAKNPLTARVMVNRIWHHLFGTGIVRSVDNFGRTGERPSHPELLDYLATRFVEEGWSIKKMIRMMMLSRTYQLSSRANPKAAAADPENRLLARMNRRRLEAEAIHDAILYVSGQLDLTMGGPTIKKGTAIEYGYRFDGTRRAVYTPVFRNTLPELFAAFDFADPNLVTGRRSVSTVAPQALFLMNNPFVIEQAQHFASRILAKNNLTDAQRVELAYRMALGRLPSENERRLAMAFLTRKSANPVDEWTSFCQTLFACIDFRYVN
ncbi:MAG: hypothetical protein KatS3mg105_0008 [Gemmatales bacterium]|nr:MAG: hypothetical protein KatS3mg105_0008 [Gemmatales bacterium]